MGLDDRGLQWRLPLGFAAFLTVVVALLTHRWMDSGRFPPAVPVAAVVLIAVLSGVVLWFGQAVRRYLRGTKANLSPIRAARTLALAQAAALTGSALVGLYAGQALGLLPDWDLQAAQRLLWGYAAGIAAATWLLVVGMVVQSWCRIPPVDKDSRQSREEPEPAH